jgi:hypothetical protein
VSIAAAVVEPDGDDDDNDDYDDPPLQLLRPIINNDAAGLPAATTEAPALAETDLETNPVKLCVWWP